MIRKILMGLALAAAFLGLQLFTNTALAATTKTWAKFCENQTYVASASAGVTQYDQNQAAFIFKVNVAASSVNADTQILRYGASNSNYVYVKTTVGGKYRIEIWRNGQSQNLTQDSTVDVTEGYHVFALKVRRGDGTTGQLLSTILYMDGSEIAKIVYGQDGRASDLKFSGNPMSTMEIGQSGKENNISMYRINAVESSVASYDADTTDMQTYVADANELYPPLVAFFYGSTMVDGATYTAPDGIVYTLAANGNTAVAGGGIQISANKGVSVTPASGNVGNQATTVIIKYTNFDTSSLASADAKVLIVNHTADTSYKDMLGMAATEGGNIWGLWQNTTWSNNKTTTGVYGSSASDVKQFALGWTQTETAAASVGTYFCMDGQNKTGWSSLHGSKDIDSVWIGGPNEGTGVVPATGMKILGIAVFGGRLSDAEMAAYAFPPVTYTATISGDTKFSEITTWSPARPATGFDRNSKIVINNTAAAKLTMDEDVTALSFAIQNTSGNGLTLGLDGHCITAAWDQTAAAGGVTVDATGVPGASLARYAVAGAPYSYWYIRGTGTLPNNPSTMPTMPDGYTATAEKYTGTGLRLVVTATSAQFGSVNINFAGGRSSQPFIDDSKVGTYETMQGGFPVIGTSWNDLEAKNYTGTATKYIDTDGTVKTDGNISVKVTQCNNPYTTGQGDDYKHTITYGYIDDGGNPIVEISNIPFAKYRVIVYRATDGTGTFSAAQIGTASSDTKIYYGPTRSSTTAAVTFFGDSEVGWGKGQQAGYTEGMNYVVSDVLEGTPGSATAYIYSRKYDGRAGVAAIQIVEVGAVAQIGDTKYPSLAAAEAAVEPGETIQLLMNWNESLTTAKAFTLDLNGKTLTGTLTIGDAGAVTLDYNGGTLSSTITGSGTIVYNGVIPTSVPTGITADAWTGTVWLENKTGVGSLELDVWGNANSTVRLTGIQAYFNTSAHKATTVTFPGTLEVKNTDSTGETKDYALDINNGWSGATTAFGRLKGDGLIKDTTERATQTFTFDNVSEFTGGITLSHVKFKFGTGDATLSDGSIIITAAGSAAVAAGKTWTTGSNGVKVNGKISGAGTLASATTFADNAELDARASLLTANSTLAFGANTKVRVAAAPTAANPLVKVMNKSNAGQSVFGTTVALYVGEATEATSGNFKLAYYNDGLYVAFVQNLAAEITESTSWSQIPWSGTALSPFDTYTLTVTGDDIVLAFDQIVNTAASLTINGNVTVAMADTLYEDGCWEKTFATFGTLTAANVTLADLKEGFYGAYSQAATGFKLRAQNKEVISINIAGGSGGGTGGDSPTENLVTGDGFHGIAPTVGSSWNNINRQWQSGGNQTITINSPNAYDGQTTIQRPTMSLSATGKNTYQCGDITNPFLRGYLDDGNGVTVMVHGIPYTKYDVIVYATSDEAGIKLAPVTINGTQYTFADGETKPGSTVWGQGKYATPEVGKNALRINNCEGGTLTINAVRASNPDGRATLCAVQVINKGEVVVSSKYVADVTVANVIWTTGDDEGLTKYGQAWANSQLSTLTLTNKANATLTFNPSPNDLTGMTFKVVSAADYKLTIPSDSLAKLSFAQLDFSEAAGKVEIDLAGVTPAETTLIAGTLTGADNITCANGSGCGVFADATGIHLAKTADVSRNNPVTGVSQDFTFSFFGTDGVWEKAANWRKATDGLWRVATAVPGDADHSYEPLMIDGDEDVAFAGDELEGYSIQYAFLGGADVTVSKLRKMQAADGVTQFIWVDEDSSFTVSVIGDSNNWNPVNLYVAAENGITFPAISANTCGLNYYLKGDGSVKFTGAVTAGTHTIKQMDLVVGTDGTKPAKHVAKKKLVTLAAGTTVVFAKADDIVVNLDNDQVTATYQADIPTVQNDVGTYTITKEDDGVYAYVVQYADRWDIKEPLTGTLEADTAWGDIVWLDAYGHEGADLTLPHTYKVVGTTFTATKGDAFVEGSSVEVVSGTLALDTTATIGTEPYKVDAGATLLVKVSGLAASKVTNNGTIRFEGGTAEAPIAIAGDANFGIVTLAANTYVKNTVTNNRNHLVTGTDLTSCYAVSKASGEPGMGSVNAFTNLTFITDTASGSRMWVERITITDECNVGLKPVTTMYLAASGIIAKALNGSGAVTGNALTINCSEAANYSGTSAVAFTIGGTAVQTLSGAYTGALTVNAGATVALAGTAAPSAIVNNGTVVYKSGCTCNLGTARSPNGTCVFEEGAIVTATQTAAEYAQGLVSAFTGFNEGEKITLNKLDGTSEELTVDAEGKASSTAGAVHIDGAATYADATFTNATSSGAYHIGTLAYKAYNGLKLQYDSAVTTNAAGTGAYLKHHPWIEGFPNSFFAGGDLTIAVVGEMSPSNNTTFVHLGNTTDSNAGVLLATGAKEDEVVVKVNTGTSLEEITTMTVPHAATARHVYVITKTDTDTQSIFSVYLDGTPWKTVKLAKKTFTGGVQCGSDFGGQLRNKHIVEAVTSDDTALINVLRVYDRVIGKAEIDAYSDAYPYVSESGTSSRTFTAAAANWIEAEGGTCWSFKQTAASEAVLTNAPAASSAIEIDGTEEVETTIAVNLDEDAHHDSVAISSPGSFKFAKVAGKAGLIVSGQTTIGCPVEIEYASLDISGAPLTLIDEGAVVFDLSGVDFSKYFANATILLTGDTDETNKITVKGLPETPVAGRTVEFGYNGQQYVVTVTVDTATPFIFTIADGWTWSTQSVTAETVSNNTALAINVNGDLTWDIDRSDITVKAGTLTVSSVTKRAAEVTVEKGAVLDLNGQKAQEMNLTLAGGKITNSSSETLSEGDQIKTMTLTASSEINVPNAYQVYAQSYNTETTIELNEYTLTKTGEGQLKLVNTDITGSGTFCVSEGKVFSGESTRFGEDATLKIGANGMWEQRDGSRKTTVSKIVGEGGTLNVVGQISGFDLSGTLTLTGDGTWGTITNAADTVATVGQKRGLVFAGAGTVNVTLTDAEIAQEGPITIFTAAEGATTVGGTVVDKDGNEVPGTFTGGSFQVAHEAKIGTTYYLTLAEALNAANGNTVTLLKDVATKATIVAGKALTLDLNGKTLQNAVAGYTIDNAGTLTIVDSAEVKGMVTHLTADTSSTIRNLGTLTVSDITVGGTYIGIKNDEGAGCNGGKGYGELTLNGVTFEGNDQAVQNWGEATVNGGTFNGKVFTWACETNTGNKNGRTTINEGTFNADVWAVQQFGGVWPTEQATVTVNGGTFETELKLARAGEGTPDPKAKIAIPGDSTAQFKFDQTAFCETGYETALVEDYYEVSPVTYAIAYFDGEAPLDLSPATYTIESEAITLPTPTKPNYDFLGWYDNAELTGDAVTTIAAGSTGDKAFYSKWELALVNITIPTIPNISGKIVFVGEQQYYPVSGTTYQVPPGSNVKVIYTAAEGYVFEDKVVNKTLWLNDAQEGDELDVSGIESQPAGAKIGTTLYLTLASAAADAKDGNTVTMLADDLADGITCSANVTLDINGKNLGVFKSFNSVADLKLVNGVASQGGFYVNGTVNVKGGTLDASGLAVAQGGVIPGQAGGIAVANGATFAMMNEWAGYSPNWLAANREGFLAAADGGMVKMGATVYTAQNGLFGTENTVAKAVTTAYGVTYTETFDSLAAAIAAAVADTTVTLVADASVGELTLDKGFTLDVDGNVATFGGAVSVTAGTVALKNSQSTAPEMGTSAGGILVGAPISVAAGATLDLSLMPFGKDVYGGIDANPPTAYLDLASGSTAKFFYWGLATKEEVDTPNWMYGNLPIFFKDGAIPDGATVVIGTKTWTGSTAKGRFVIANEIAIATVQGEHNPVLDPGSPTFTFTESFDSVAMAFAAAADKTVTLTAAYALAADAALDAGNTLVLGTGSLSIPEGVTLALGGTLKTAEWGMNFSNLGAMVIDPAAKIYMGEAQMFGEGGKFTIQSGAVTQTVNTAGTTDAGMKYVITADGAATMVGDFVKYPGTEYYCLDTFWLNDGATFTATEADEEQGLKCVKAVNPEKKIVCNEGVYSVADKGPTPAPGSDVKVDPVPGHENTYVVTPTAEEKSVVIQGVKDGDTLIVNGTEVDTLTVNNTNDVTITVMNKANDYDITGAVYGFRPKPVVKKLALKGLKLAAAEANEVFPFSTELDPELVNLGVSNIVVGADVRIDVSAYLGLSCQLLRGTEVTNVTSVLVTEGASAVITNTPTLLIDSAKPAGKAFYKIQVTK